MGSVRTRCTCHATIERTRVFTSCQDLDFWEEEVEASCLPIHGLVPSVCMIAAVVACVCS
jgi:hypothetical protein